ncbi:hypothetical protein POM88_030439 [Heracleum sosnowskyi]|uniref:Retrotransposon gag domain-containing protein n=1 Tax=Heracleum sosnowskyi TaxID=360622 RepID=A0AAD8HWY8_9APIA|nr:hypothetical protein POM88_030439 [Heracleum sosnowskyi]
MAGGSDSKLEGSNGDFLNLTLKNMTDQLAYLAEQIQATNARIEATYERIEGVVTTVETTHLWDVFIRNPKPTNDDYDDTSLTWYVPKFSGAGDSEDFLEWVSHMEYLFDYKGFDDQRSYKISNMKLTKYAYLWFINLKINLVREGAPRITTWTEMKRQLNNHFGLKECTEDKVAEKDEVKLDIVNVEDKHVESQSEKDDVAIPHSLNCIEHETKGVLDVATVENCHVEPVLLVRGKQTDNVIERFESEEAAHPMQMEASSPLMEIPSLRHQTDISYTTSLVAIKDASEKLDVEVATSSNFVPLPTKNV